ncbi:MAG: AraC family transcriptional regulator [Victivallales bacterium]|nr:AraC family transcriptional regulator [Victivallales bacterium]
MDYSILMLKTLKEFSCRENTDKTMIFRPHPESCWENLPGFIFHTSYEIFFQIDGGCRFVFPHENIVIHPGDVIIVPPGSPHKEYAFNEDGRRFRNLLAILSASSLTIHIAESHRPRHPSWKPDPVSVEHVKTSRYKLYWELAKNAEHVVHENKLLLLRTLQAMTAMFRDDLEVSRQARVAQSAQEGHYKVDMVKALISWNPPPDMPTVSELARRVGLSANYLSGLFRQHTGEPLKTYMNRIRVERAENMLLSTNKSIAEIAWMCGFRDAAYFSRIFERYAGIKPFEYRFRHTLEK